MCSVYGSTTEASLCGGDGIVTEFRSFFVWSVILDEHGSCMATLDPQLKNTHTHTVLVSRDQNESLPSASREPQRRT